MVSFSTLEAKNCTFHLDLDFLVSEVGQSVSDGLDVVSYIPFVLVSNLKFACAI